MTYKDAKRLVGLSTDVVDTPTFSDDYTTNSGWTQVGSWASISGGKASFNGGNNADHRISKSLGITLSDSMWVWTFVYNSGQTDFGYQVLSSGTTNPDSNNTDYIGIYNGGASSNGITLIRADSGVMSTSSWITGLSQNTDYYVKIIRESATSVSLYLYSDINMSNLIASRTSTILSSIQNLSNIVHSSITGGGSSSGNSWSVDDSKIYNGVSSLTNKPLLSESNGIFLEINTGKYLWRDKSKEWLIPIYNAIIMGGNESGSIVSTVQTYNGITWNTVSPLSTARRRGMGGGSLSDAIVAGGVNSVPTYLSSSEEYNGTSWSGGGTLPSPKSNGGGGGNTSDAFVVRGYTTGDVKQDTTFEYNGTSWSSGGSCSPAAGFIGADGNSTDAIVAGGYSDAPATNYNTSFEYNGTSWSSGGNLSSINQSPSVGGSTTNAICVDGYTGGYTNNTQEYNGTSWSAGGSVSSNRYVGSTRGSADKALTVGGTSNTTSESYNGTSWNTVGSISAVRHSMAMGGSA